MLNTIKKNIKKIKFLFNFIDFFRIKIYSLKFLKKYNTKHGMYYLPFFAFEDVIRKKIINNEISDKNVYINALPFIKKNSIVLDVGANFGQLSVLFSSCKKNVEVFSFEASHFVASVLKKNIEINNANVKVIHALVAEKSRKKSIFLEDSILNDHKTYGSNMIKLSKRSNLSVKQICIDDIQFNNKISLMKIDVQGYDLKVLKGAKKTIKRMQMPIIFEYEECFAKESGDFFDDYLKFINEIGYVIKKRIDSSNFLIIPK